MYTTEKEHSASNQINQHLNTSACMGPTHSRTGSSPTHTSDQPSAINSLQVAFDLYWVKSLHRNKHCSSPTCTHKKYGANTDSPCYADLTNKLTSDQSYFQDHILHARMEEVNDVCIKPKTLTPESRVYILSPICG